MDNPYQGHEYYDTAWQDGFNHGQQYPGDTDPAAPTSFPPLELDEEYLGYLQRVWLEGALAGREHVPVAVPAAVGAAGAVSQHAEAAEPSWEARERDREASAVTREHHPGDVSSWFQSDWVGREILARYLAGDGDWEIEDPHWSDYMRANEGLRHKLEQHAHYVIANVAALGDDEGSVPVNEEFHVDIENGEGMVGYQYLHGTDANAGGFTIYGWARMVPAEAAPDANESSAERRVHYYFEYTWNDNIDPNPEYGTDQFKAAIAYAISAGGAAAYRIAIKWHGEGVVTVGSNGEVLEIHDTSGSGETLNCYPLR